MGSTTESKTVLVTGGAGFIGSHIARQLIEQGHTVVVYDAFIQYLNPLENSFYQRYLQNRFNGFKEQVTFVRGDTRDKQFLKEAIDEYRPTHILHLAALPIADLGDKNPEEANSSVVQGAINVLDNIKDRDHVERFVYTSSSMIYGDFQYDPADELHPKQPKGVYGGAKLAGEIMTESYGRRYDIPYTIIRPSAVYGPGDVNRRVTQIFIENALRGKPIKLHNGGVSKLDFSFVEDVADGFVRAAFSPEAVGETFNITRGEGRQLKELADTVESLVDRPVEIEETSADVYRPERGSLDITKAKDKLGFEPKHSLEDGMRKYYEFLKPIYNSSAD
jgi:nucleoside-diphosphate-sugar epimerase